MSGELLPPTCLRFSQTFPPMDVFAAADHGQPICMPRLSKFDAILKKSTFVFSRLSFGEICHRACGVSFLHDNLNVSRKMVTADK